MELYKIAASNLKGIGIKKLKQLCVKTQGLKTLFEKDIEALSLLCNVKKERLRLMDRGHALKKAKRQLDFNKKYGIQTLYFDDLEYPPLLKECADAPITLFFKGNVSLLSRTISIVGTRKGSTYGKENVEKLISSLQGREIMVVSGLATGIDTFVHECCMKYKIPTVGVLGHGLDTMYPKSNRNLAREMCFNGGLLTEYCIDHKVSKYCFPRRNRIIAGLSDVTIVIESPSYGGAMITAEMANGYNREVMAIPGSIFSNYSKGCNDLIKNQKAHLMADPLDLFKLMNWNLAYVGSLSSINLTEQESLIVNLLNKEKEIHFDSLVHKSTFSVSLLHSLILNLELKQIVHSLPGAMFRLNRNTFSSGMV